VVPERNLFFCAFSGVAVLCHFQHRVMYEVLVGPSQFIERSIQRIIPHRGFRFEKRSPMCACGVILSVLHDGPPPYGGPYGSPGGSGCRFLLGDPPAFPFASW